MKSAPGEAQALPDRLRESADEVMEFPHPSQCDHLHDAAATMREAAARIAELEAEVRRLRAALEPFTEFNSSEPTIEVFLNTEDITRARAALAARQESPK
jgi:uncharacterized small protein (DUF1192 family)